MRTNLIYALQRSRSTLLLCVFANEVYFALRISNRKVNPRGIGQARAGNRSRRKGGSKESRNRQRGARTRERERERNKTKIMMMTIVMVRKIRRKTRTQIALIGNEVNRAAKW